MNEPTKEGVPFQSLYGSINGTSHKTRGFTAYFRYKITTYNDTLIS